MENLIVELKQGDIKIKKEYPVTTPLRVIVNDIEDLVLSLAKKSLKQ